MHIDDVEQGKALLDIRFDERLARNEQAFVASKIRSRFRQMPKHTDALTQAPHPH